MNTPSCTASKRRAKALLRCSCDVGCERVTETDYPLTLPGHSPDNPVKGCALIGQGCRSGRPWEIMRLVDRHDLFLLGGLVIALFVVFSQALEKLFDLIWEIEQTSGLRLLPALGILATVFVFHQLRKRREMRAEALGAAAAARQATERAAEMERLVAFGQALARSLNEESIQTAAASHIPLLVPGRGAWVLVRSATQWRPLITVGDSLPADRERAARMALSEADPSVGDAEFACFPMVIA